MLLAGLLLGAVGPAGATPPDVGARHAYESAREAFGEKDFTAALAWLEKAEQLDPQPVYVYNRGRTLDALGRYREALQAFLRVAGLGAGDVAQVDDRVVADPARDQLFEPGDHQVCVAREKADVVRCWRRRLEMGRLAHYPFPSSPQTRGELGWGRPPPEGARVILNGHALLLPVGRSKRIEVDAGQHRVELRDPGGASAVVQVTVVAGTGAPVLIRFPGAVSAPTPLSARLEPGPSAWPWVTAGVGAALAGGGVVLLVEAAGVRSPEKVEDGSFADLGQAEQEERWAGASGRWTAGLLLVGVGAATVTAGIIWGLSDRPSVESRGSGAPPQPSLWIAPGPAGAAFGGRF